MPRLFAGTPWDRPPACDRCGRLVSECACPPPMPDVKRIPPEQQTARLMTERRAKGKLVTVIAGLDPAGNDLTELATLLKNACGAGGTPVPRPAIVPRTPVRDTRTRQAMANRRAQFAQDKGGIAPLALGATVLANYLTVIRPVGHAGKVQAGTSKAV